MINWDRVRSLKEEVGAEDFDEIINLFFIEVDAAVNCLPDAKDPKTLSAAMHFLKGAALNLGFETLSQTCDEGEALAANRGTDAVEIDQIVGIYEQSKTHFVTEMPGDICAASGSAVR